MTRYGDINTMFFTASICYSLLHKSHVHVSSHNYNTVPYLPHLWELTWIPEQLSKRSLRWRSVTRKLVKFQFWVTNYLFKGCFECNLKLPVVWSDAVKCYANVPIEPGLAFSRAMTPTTDKSMASILSLLPPACFHSWHCGVAIISQ